MDIQLPQIIFQLINFGVVVGALSYLLYRPILNILEERRRKILAGQKAAEESLQEKAKIEELQKKARQKAQQEAAKIIAEAKKKAQEQAESIKKQAKKEAQEMLAKMQTDFRQEKQQQLKSLKAEFNQAVIAVAAKVIANELDAKKHQKLIDQELDQLLKAI